ncbi:hypothetical protein B0G80_4788 [Paraburkholderia sp. BL6669N2]|uniref:hypothetical protein n=1 Tax=Paraburkholderia sp. BL6669N2 TaxID=1938807 RepID=UPI000E25DBD1|nr:hypothetical protein [Paraburkholderia sp. BL6669N2]REG48548.1 hypothetical protein B0G80_4788 [Paraburkholderia sp. BL6669N2]
MNDAFERRALLLHLGDVLEVANRLLKCGDGHKTVRELAEAHDPLGGLPLLEQVSPRMTAEQFVQRVSDAFFAWPRELLEPELNRRRLASTVRRSLFAGNAEGWRAYVAALRGEVPWFGAGLPPLKAGEDVCTDSTDGSSGSLQADEAPSASDVERNGGQAEDQRESVESSGRVYPSWPWKSDA